MSKLMCGLKNNWDKKKCTVVIILIVSAVALIVGICCHSAIVVAAAVFVQTVMIGELVRLFVFDKRKRDYVEAMRFVIVSVVALGLWIVTFPPNTNFVKANLVAGYFPNDPINLDISKGVNTSPSAPRKIFAFDNSGDGLDDLIPSRLEKSFNQYKKRVCDFMDDANTPYSLTNKKSYRHYLALRMCYDMVKFHESVKDSIDFTQFKVIKIGARPKYVEDADAPRYMSKKEDVAEAIQIVLNAIGYRSERHTLFPEFFNEVTAWNKSNVNMDASTMIYVYSDFRHDNEFYLETDKFITNIDRQRREQMGRFQGHVYFIDDHRGTDATNFILRERLPNEFWYAVGELDDDTKVPDAVERRAAEQYYSSELNLDGNIDVGIPILFHGRNNEVSIRLMGLHEGKFRLDNNDAALGTEWQTFVQMNTAPNFIKYEGPRNSIINETVIFEVRYKNKHYFLPLQIRDKRSLWLFLICIGLIGFVLAFAGVQEKNNE